MKSEILSFLKPVRSRLRTQTMISLLSPGATLGGIVCVLLGLGRFAFDTSVTVPLLCTAFFGCLAASALMGLLLRRTWGEAASAVDTHYDLKDRTVTALEFADDPDATAYRQLQLNDARKHLSSVNAADVVPFQAPTEWRWAVLSLAATALLMVTSTGGGAVQAEVANTDGIVEAAAEIEVQLEEMEELAEEAGVEELQRLVDELKKDLEQLEKPDVEVRESLETISQMQQKMQQMMAELNVAAMDAQLSEVAEAMAGASAFKPASDALKKKQLSKAADELEAVKPENMERTESRPTSEKLAQAAASAKKKGMGKFSDALEQLSQSVKSGDSEGTCKNCDKLAKAVRKHDLRKSMCKMLNSKCNALGQCKKMCSGNCKKSGNGAGQGLNLAKGQSKAKSNNPSKKAGAKSAGNIDGEKTQLDSERQMAKLTGQMGAAGDSEFETETSPEAQESAQRRAREAFAKYQKMSEAVLDSEPIPLGHRQTIRKYFELIRPTTEESSMLDDQLRDE